MCERGLRGNPVALLFCGMHEMRLSPIIHTGIHNFDRKLWNYRSRICNFYVLLYVQMLA